MNYHLSKDGTEKVNRDIQVLRRWLAVKRVERAAAQIKDRRMEDRRKGERRDKPRALTGLGDIF